MFGEVIGGNFHLIEFGKFVDLGGEMGVLEGGNVRRGFSNSLIFANLDRFERLRTGSVQRTVLFLSTKYTKDAAFRATGICVTKKSI